MNNDYRRMAGARAPSRRSGTAWLLLVGALVAPQTSHAVVLSGNLAFTKVNQNPWVAGDAFQSAWTWDPGVSFDVHLPATGLTPWSVLSDYLHLPDVGFARASGHASGSFGLNLGYAVDGGRMNILYPGNAAVDFHGLGGTSLVSPGVAVTTDTSFTAGLTHSYRPPSTFTPMTGPNAITIPGWSYDTIQTPTFKTYFPNASAWAGFNYDVAAGFQLQAGVADTPLGCIACVSQSADIHRAGGVEIVNVNPGGVQILDQTRVNLFHQDFSLGAGSVRVDYPDISVDGALQPDGTTLAGSAAASMISFNGDLEKLVPLVGPLLHESVGPLDVKLLGVSGGPSLGLYQDFQLDVAPKVDLLFNQPVVSLSGGSPLLTTSIETTLGGALDWMPVIGSGGTPLQVQAVFKPDATLHNRTGFSVGYDLNVSALELGTPLGHAGPLAAAQLQDPGALYLPPFYDQQFSLGLGDIALDPFTFDTATQVDPFGHRAAFETVGITPKQGGPADLFTLSLVDTLTGVPYSIDVTGGFLSPQGGSGPDAHDSIFVSNSDVVVDYLLSLDAFSQPIPLDLGTYFCVYCADGTGDFMPVSQSFVDAATGDPLFVSDLSNPRSDSVDYLQDPSINRSTFDIASIDSAVLGPVVPVRSVPEPATLSLFAAGLAALGLRRRRPVLDARPAAPCAG